MLFGASDCVRLCVTAGKIPALEDMVCLRFKDHMVITVEPSHEKTVSSLEMSSYTGERSQRKALLSCVCVCVLG